MNKADPAGAVLFLLNSLTMGGSERKTVRLANTLAADYSNVVIAYLNGPVTLEPEVSSAVRLVHLERKGKFSFRAVAALHKVVRDLGVKTIVAVNLYPCLYATLLQWRMGRQNLRVVATVNTTEFVSVQEQRQMHLYRHVLKRTDLVVFGAQCQERLWGERYGIRAPAVKTAVLYNGIDTQYFHNEGQWQTRGPEWPAARFIVGSIGKMRAEKSQHHLLAAVAELRSKGIDAGAVIVGDGPQREMLEATIARLKIGPYAYLPGETADVRAYLANFDVFVLPSTAVETFSNAALEAMAMGCPVVSSDVGGMAEMLQAGGGLLYEPGDVQGLVALLETLSLSAGQVRKLGEEARKVAIERFSWQQMLARFKSTILARGI